MIIEKRVFNITDFCKAYGICRTTAYAEIKSGRLARIKVGRRTLIAADAAEAWLRALADNATGVRVAGSSLAGSRPSPEMEF
jgi:hypothetical protein